MIVTKAVTQTPSHGVKLMIEILTLIGVHFRLVRSYIYTRVDAIYGLKYGLD